MRKNSNLATSQVATIASPNERLNSFLGFSLALPCQGLIARIQAMVEREARLLNQESISGGWGGSGSRGNIALKIA